MAGVVVVFCSGFRPASALPPHSTPPYTPCHVSYQDSNAKIMMILIHFKALNLRNERSFRPGSVLTDVAFTHLII